MPETAQVFARERWERCGHVRRLSARRRRGAMDRCTPGTGTSAFPTPLQALTDLGLSRPSARIDCGRSSMERIAAASTPTISRALAQVGVAALYVAAWHHFEADPEQTPICAPDCRGASRRDPGLRLVRVAACQRKVLERSPGVAARKLPQSGRAARLGKLMNLRDRDCSAR